MNVITKLSTPKVASKTAGNHRPKKTEATAIRWKDLKDYPFLPREDLVSPWLRQGESAMMWAAPGVGKTLLALTLALLVSGGGEVAGWSSPKPRRVLLVDGEMNAEDLKDRIVLLMDTVEGIDRAAVEDNLLILPRTLQSDSVAFPNLGERELPDHVKDRLSGQDFVFSKAREHHAELVIFDNFSTLIEVADENDAAAMKTTTDFLMRLKTGGIGCILVHHSGKAGTTYRGSSNLATTFEVIMGLAALEDKIGVGESGAAFKLTWDKYRQRPHDAVRPRTMSLRDTEDGHRWVVGETDDNDVWLLVRTVETCKYRNQAAVAEFLGWDASKVTRTKAKAIKVGAITESHLKECFETPASDVNTSDF